MTSTYSDLLLIVIIRNTFPALFHIMRCKFGHAVTREYTFSISLYSDDTLTRFKVCKVPNVLAHEILRFIEYFMIRFKIEFLVLFCEHDRLIRIFIRIMV